MTALERRCRLLLRAYPAAYRREHGAEILGTLLEATPVGRRRPRARDSRSLVMGGLRARAAENRRLPIGSSLRLAAFFGLSVYLASAASNALSDSIYAELPPGIDPAHWLALPTALLIATVVVLAWLARRSAVIVAVLAAGAMMAYYGFWLAPESPLGATSGQTITVLTSLAVLAVLAAWAQQPPRSWLWLVGLAATPPVLAHLPEGYPAALFIDTLPYVTMFMVAMGIVWIGVDPRLAAGLATYLALLGLPNLVGVLQIGGGLQLVLEEAAWLWLAIVLAVPALWRLHRQTALR
jgi:hypothetical protein